MSQVSDTRRGGGVGKNNDTGDSVSVAPLPSKTPRRPRRSGWLIGTLLGLALVSTAFGVAYRTLHNIAPKGQSVASVLDSITNPAGQFPGKDRVTVVLIGKDYDRDRKGMPYTKHSRSDSIVVLSMDLKNATDGALSVPRDTHVTAPDGKTGKINGTYARGGTKLLEATLTQLLGVAPDYYVSLKADGLKEMVDSLGGVDVVALDDMNYDDNWGQLHVHLKKGSYRIDGDQAVGFTRFREVKQGTPHSKEEGDPRRMARQQMVIKAMVARAKMPANWLRLDRIINQGMDQVETDLSRPQVFALGALFKNVQPEQIQTAALVGHGTPRGAGTYFFYPDPKKTGAMVDWLLKGDEAAADRLTVVAVQNGTPVPGLARRVADVLRSRGGFDARSAGNAPDETTATTPGGGVAQTTILYEKASVQSRAEHIAQLLGGGTVKKRVPAVVKPGAAEAALPLVDAPDAPDVTVVLGRDLAPNFEERSAKL